MTTFNLTCEAVEATLPDYLDETLEAWVRTSIEEHLSECARCSGLVRELRNITREATSLPALVPERDIWARVAGRIGAPVSVSGPSLESEPLPLLDPVHLASDASLPISEPVAVASEPVAVESEPLAVASEPPVLTIEPPPPTREPLAPTVEPLLPQGTAPLPRIAPVHALPDRREKRWGPAWMGLAAAALVLVTAGITSFLTVQWLGRARTPNVASDTGARGPSASERSAKPGIRAPSVGRGQLALTSPPAPGRLGSALTVATTSAPAGTRSPEEVVYDKEINMLQRVARRQKADLDASTVAVIEKNLRTVDSAIAQIRAALEKDPESPILGGQASRALEMKVELLRRVAMLRSNT